MIEPSKPKNESERLTALRALQVLDTPLEERFERITRIVRRTMGVPISAISLVDEERQWFKSIQGLDAAETPRNIAFCAHAILKDDPLVVLDALKDERFRENPLVTEDPSIRFYAGCPLMVGEGLRIGTLCAIDQKPRELAAEELETLQDLAAMVQAELSNVALSEAQRELIGELEQAKRASLVDPLSRLWNRAGAEQLMSREWESMRRKAHPLSVAMVDIDHFKRVNDSHGHDVGDQAIRHVAKVLLQSLRPYDVLSRWGGEEFLIVLPDCEHKELESVLERLFRAIKLNPVNSSAGSLPLTVSAGAVTVYPGHDDNAEAAIKRADLALYEAKGSGRARYCIAPEEEACMPLAAAAAC